MNWNPKKKKIYLYINNAQKQSKKEDVKKRKYKQNIVRHTLRTP